MRKRKAEGAESRSESAGRVRLQPAPRGPVSDDGSAASPTVRRYPGGEAVPRRAPGVAGASRQADAVYAANPDGGTVVSVHVDTGRCSRTAGRGRSTPSPRNKLPSFREYSILRACVDREGGSISRAADWTTRRGLAPSSRGGREGSSSPSASGRIFLPPDAESGMVTQSIDLAGFRIRVDRPRLAVSARDWGALPRGHEFSQQRR